MSTPKPKNRAVLKSDQGDETPITKGPAVKVRVAGQAIHENGQHFAKGEELEVSPERRRALGGLVDEVAAPASETPAE